MKNRLLLAAVLAATIAAAASLLPSAQIVPLGGLVALVLRWVAILLIAAHATSRRSLTVWIFVGLPVGVLGSIAFFAVGMKRRNRVLRAGESD